MTQTDSSYVPIQEKAKNWLSSRKKDKEESPELLFKPAINKTSEFKIKQKREREEKKLKDMLYKVSLDELEIAKNNEEKSYHISSDESEEQNDLSINSKNKNLHRDESNKKLHAKIRSLIYKDSQKIPICHSVTFGRE